MCPSPVDDSIGTRQMIELLKRHKRPAVGATETRSASGQRDFRLAGGAVSGAVSPGDDDPTRVSLQSLVRLRQSMPLRKRPAGRRVLASVAGGNMSRALGRGLDFAEVREYNHGDDVRTIDWKVTARSGKPHTKVFNEERERPFLVVLDLRSSMFFGTRTAFKSVIAARLCALVAWAASGNRDRVGGIVFSDDTIRESQPAEGSKGVTRLLNAVATVHGQAREVSAERAHSRLPGPRLSGQSSMQSTGQLSVQSSVQQSRGLSMAGIFQRVKRSAHTGSSICLISDFPDFDARKSGHLTHLLRHNHMAACRVYDPLEAELPPPATYAISDGTNRAALNTDTTKIREAYQQLFHRRCEQTRKVFRGHGNSYSECRVDAVLTDVAGTVMRQLPGSL